MTLNWTWWDLNEKSPNHESTHDSINGKSAIYFESNFMYMSHSLAAIKNQWYVEKVYDIY